MQTLVNSRLNDLKASLQNELLDFSGSESDVANFLFNRLEVVKLKRMEVFAELITINSLRGIGGGHSRKVANIALNWRLLLEECFGKSIEIIGALGTPWLIPASALLLCRKIYGLSKIDIEENLAILIVCLWKLSDKENNIVTGEGLLSKINSEFTGMNRGEVSVDELHLLLDKLFNLRCLRFNRDGTIQMMERIKGQI